MSNKILQFPVRKTKRIQKSLNLPPRGASKEEIEDWAKDLVCDIAKSFLNNLISQREMTRRYKQVIRIQKRLLKDATE